MEIWNEALSKKEWSKVIKAEDLNEKVEIFSQFIEEALDEIAPIKSFKVKSRYKFGLSAETKMLMASRDLTRKNISKANDSNRAVLVKKYKILRNKKCQESIQKKGSQENKWLATLNLRL